MTQRSKIKLRSVGIFWRIGTVDRGASGSGLPEGLPLKQKFLTDGLLAVIFPICLFGSLQGLGQNYVKFETYVKSVSLELNLIGDSLFLRSKFPINQVRDKIILRDLQLLKNDLSFKLSLPKISKKKYYALNLQMDAGGIIPLNPEDLEGDLQLDHLRKIKRTSIIWTDILEHEDLAPMDSLVFRVTAEVYLDCEEARKFYWKGHAMAATLGISQFLVGRTFNNIANREYKVYRQNYFDNLPETEDQYRKANKDRHAGYILERSGIIIFAAGVAGGLMDYFLKYKAERRLYDAHCRQEVLGFQPRIYPSDLLFSHPGIGMSLTLTF